MLITAADCFEYTLPLKAPLSLGDRTVDERRGLLLRLKDEDGAEGWGEAAPLPGFSSETLAEASADLRRRAKALQGAELMDSVIDDVLRRQSQTASSPSVQFAVASAITELWAERRGRTVPAVLGGGRETVSLNALVSDQDENLSAAAARYREAGFRAVKLKVGRRSIEEDVARVKRLRDALGTAVSLRLDANRAWTYDQAVSFAREIQEVPIEYIEEPVRTRDDLSAFVDDERIPVALDETTREASPQIFDQMRGVAAVVLKPSLLGGIRGMQRWVIGALNVGATPVVSAAYESGVGTRMLLALASVFTEAPAGLSTYTTLEADVLNPQLSMDRAEAIVAEGYDSAVDPDRLRLIETDK